MVVDSDVDVSDLIDALDHIFRVARASRTQTRRLKWIEARARCALEGGDDWKDLDIPRSADSVARQNQVLRSKLRQHTK